MRSFGTDATGVNRKDVRLAIMLVRMSSRVLNVKGRCIGVD